MRLKALLGLLLAAAMLHAPATASAAGYPSNECDPVAGGNVVIDGFVGQNWLKLRTVPAPGDPSSRWVCYAVDDRQRHVGGKFVVSTGSGSVAVRDANWGACNLTPGKIAGEEGAIGPLPFEIEIDRPANGDVQICLMVNNAIGERILIKPSGLPSVNHQPDDPQPYPYVAPVSPGNESSKCYPATGRLLSARISNTTYWLLFREESDSRTSVCWRAGGSSTLTGAFPYGGRLTIDTAGQQSIVGLTTAPNHALCDQNILTLTDSGVLLKYHAGGTGTSHVCARIPGVINWGLDVNPNGGLGVVEVAGDTA